jgi:4-hydroxy-3-methylbut-2-enyl diphosphate reductase
MEILVAKSAGYCYGVQNAIDKVDDSISKYNKSIYTLGPIIHNKQVIDKFESQGVFAIKDIDETSEGIIIIRSHGVQPSVYEHIKSKNLEIVDATCPYVKNIQQKVEKYYKQGYQIIIIGSKEHPEVVGVNGWCNNTALIIDSIEQAKNISYYKKICVVSQTTIIQENFSQIISNIVFKSKEIVIFNTICKATKTRQDETKQLSKIVDAMIIIGGYHSSNTQKLVNICKEHCNNIFHIETYKDISLSELKKYNKVGITAGASTPDWIIKEVIKKMEKEMNNQENVQIDFEESLDESMVRIKPGEIIIGDVISISKEEVMVNIGYKSDGLITKNEFTDKKDIPLTDLIKVGDKVEAMVLSLNDGEGNVVLSKKRVEDKKAAERLNSAFESQEVLYGKIIKSIKGGFIVDLGIKDVFMPISQYHVKFLKDPESVVGEDIVGRIIEYNPQKNRIIFSQRVVLEKEIKEKKEKVFNSLEEGKTITGEVKSIVKFGAFIDLGGIDGLIHISDLSWGRVKNPEDVLSKGDTVTAMVMEVDREKEKVRLSLKHLVEEPWAKVFRIYSVGDKVKVKIVKITSFGAFAEIISGVEGLIHKSQISYDNVENVEDYLSIGQEVDTEIIDMNDDKKKIGLSMIALQDKPTKKIESNETVYKEEDDLTLGDIFGNLFKDKE